MVSFKKFAQILLLQVTLLSTVQPSIMMAMQPTQRLNQQTQQQARHPQQRSFKAEIAGLCTLLIVTGIALYLINKVELNQILRFFNPQPRNPQQPQPHIPQHNPQPQPHHYNPAEGNCPVCLASPDDVGPEQVYMTRCCNKFLCKNDFDKMEKDAHEEHLTFQNPEWRREYAQAPDFTGWPETHEHATCPVCRRYPLQVVKEQKTEAQPTPAPVPAATPAADPAKQIECKICSDDKDQKDVPQVSCGHNDYCRGCLTQLVDNAIKEKNTQQLRCPDCKQPFNEQDIRNITNNNRNKLNAFHDIMMREWIAQQPNAKHCPTPNCPNIFFNENPNNQFNPYTCQHCNKQYCANCLLTHTPTTTCQQAKIDHELARNPNAADRATEQWKRQNTKPCPHCHTRIEKNNGCDSMRCKACKHYFCWACLKELARDHEGHNCAGYNNAWLA